MCQCLGSEFDVTTGAVVHGPADRPLNVYDVQVIPDNDDDPKAIAQTRQYLRDFIRLDGTRQVGLDRWDNRVAPHRLLVVVLAQLEDAVEMSQRKSHPAWPGERSRER